MLTHWNYVYLALTHRFADVYKMAAILSRSQYVKVMWGYYNTMIFIQKTHFNRLMQERHNSNANTLELRLSCTNPSLCRCLQNGRHFVQVTICKSNVRLLSNWSPNYLHIQSDKCDTFDFAREPHWWLVKIGSDNGLVLSGNKPLPEPLSTKISNAL